MRIIFGLAIIGAFGAGTAVKAPRPVSRVAFLSASEGYDDPPRHSPYVSAAGEYESSLPPPTIPPEPPAAAEELPKLPADAFAVPKFTPTVATSPVPVNAPVEDACEVERDELRATVAELRGEVAELHRKLSECLSRPTPDRGITVIPRSVPAPAPVYHAPAVAVPIYRGNASSECVQQPTVYRRGLFGRFR